MSSRRKKASDGRNKTKEIDHGNVMKSEKEASSEKIINNLSKYLTVLGAALDADGRSIGIAIQLENESNNPIVIPNNLLGRHNPGQAESWFLENGLADLVDDVNLREIGKTLRKSAFGKTVTLISEPGYHNFAIDGKRISGYAWDNKFHQFGSKYDGDILLVERAAKRVKVSGDVELWNHAFKPYLSTNPRLLAVVCFAMASVLYSPFKRNGIVLALVGISSRGKSTCQRVAASVIGSKKRVIAWDGTPKGMFDLLTDFRDQPSFFDDMHTGGDVEDIMKLIMNVGNGARRILAKRASGKKPTPRLKTNLTVSTEEGILALANRSRNKVSSGILARYFEIHLGKYGMFDDLCGHAASGDVSKESGGDLSKVLDKKSAKLRAALWSAWIEALSKDWTKVVKWHEKEIAKIRLKILLVAGNPVCDDVTSRMLDSLAFAAFAGCVASKLEILDVKRKVICQAFGLLLKEHIGRQPEIASPIAQIIVDEIRGYLKTHASNFPSLAMFYDPHLKNGIAGFVTDDRNHGKLFLFTVAAFREKFVNKFGSEVFEHLRSAGFLVSHRKRHNRLSKSLPSQKGKKRRRTDFIAISDEILYTDGK